MSRNRLLVRSGITLATLAGGALFSFGANSAGLRSTGPVNTPPFVAQASTAAGAKIQDLGQSDPTQKIDVSIWLNVHNRQAMDQLVKDVYNPKSPKFRQWLTKEEFNSTFAPTATEVQTVKDFFTSHNLTVKNVGPVNLFVRATGTVADVQKAFNVALHDFQVNGERVRANTSDPIVEGAAGNVTRTVAGLTTQGFHTDYVSRNNVKLPAAKQGALSAEAAGGRPANFFPNTCFDGNKTIQMNYGFYPTAYAQGLHYFGNQNVGSCGYIPQDIYTAYNLRPLYKSGLDGTGQTIVIVDWCGSNTILTEANAFSAQFGLPALNSSNFQQVFYPTASTCEATNVEIDIDVEWAHAIAPGANILLLVPPSASFQDIDASIAFAAIYQLGSVISGSFGAEEAFVPSQELDQQNLVNELAALNGVSANFATGDNGDFTFDYPQFNPPSVSVPAATQYATAVGGVSLVLHSDSTFAGQTGWGTNETVLAGNAYVYDPPLNAGFVFGSGGGPSGYFTKPWYQSGLSGTSRELPDISWLADPFTGGVIATSSPFQYPSVFYQVYGGTSLATPMFSALWAIANQNAGMWLGQASAVLYSMPSKTIQDVLPVSFGANREWVKSSATAPYVTYGPQDLAQPLENTTIFSTAIWDYPAAQDTELVITFGTDSGLVTTPGWDNVTGLGVPNGPTFVNYFTPKP